MTTLEQEYAVAVGANLRAVRRAVGYASLMDVEEKSDGEWKAVVVGSYERGDRHPSIGRLHAYCTWLGVPLVAVLPGARPTPGQVEVWALLVLDRARALVGESTEDEPGVTG